MVLGYNYLIACFGVNHQIKNKRRFMKN